MTTTTVEFMLRTPNAKLPTYATADSVGMDIYAAAESVIPAGGYGAVRAGISLVPDSLGALGEGYCMRIVPRSGPVLGAEINFLVCVIDRHYTGEILVVLENLGRSAFVVNEGTCVAQMIVEPYLRVLPVAACTNVRVIGIDAAGAEGAEAAIHGDCGFCLTGC